MPPSGRRCRRAGLRRPGRSPSRWLAAGLLALLAGHAQAQAPRLFSAGEPSDAGPSTPLWPEVAEPGGATVRARRARMDFDPIAGQVARPQPGGAAAPAFTLNLFDDAVYDVVDLSRAPTAGGYSLSGRLDGVPFGDVTLVVNGDVVAGSVTTPGATFMIGSTADGAVEIRETDPSTLPPLSAPVPVPLGSTGEPREAGAGQPHAADATPSDEPTIIDVLVAFSTGAKDLAGGLDRVRARIDLDVAITNRAYEDSGVLQRINLVGTLEVKEEPTNSHNALARLAGTSDGHMDEVHAVRDTLGADIVILVASHGDCGRAYLLTNLGQSNDVWAFGRVLYACGTAFAHELGHIMGLNHDRYQQRFALSNKPHPWSYGYVNQAAFKPKAPASKGWRTIMSYQIQCTVNRVDCRQIARFSNPDQSIDGDPLGGAGDAATSAVDGPADARRTLNISRTSVAGFRPTAPIRASARRLTPLREKTNADTLTWRVTFTPREPKNVDATDFVLRGAGLGAPVLTAAAVDAGKRHWDVSASGGNLAALDGTVTLDFAAGHDIADGEGAKVSSAWVSGSERTYTLDNDAPGVASLTRHDPASQTTHADTLTWRVVFDEDVQGIGASDFELAGTTATLAVAALAESPGVDSATTFDATASGGDLAALTGTVELGFSAHQNIIDFADNALDTSMPAGAQTSYEVRNAARPGTVAGVSVAARVGSLEVSWRPARGATGYKVQWKPRKQSAYAPQDEVTVAGDATSHVIGGLSADEEYTVRVLAVKAGADDGAPSAEVSGKPRGGSLAVAAVDASVAEGAGVRFRATLSGPAAYDLSIPVSVTETGAMLDGAPPTSFEVATGAATALLTVATVDDAVVEKDSLVTASVSSVPGYRVSTGSAETWVRDDDAPSFTVTSVEAVAATVSEGDGASFRVRLSAAAGRDRSIPVSVTETGAMLAGEPPTSVAVKAGQSSALLTVATDDDAVVEPESVVTVTVSADSGYRTTAGAARMRVRDDDSATFSVTASPAAIDELVSETRGGFTFSWPGRSTVTVAVSNGVTFSTAQQIALVASGTAGAGDYALSSTSLTLAAGESAVSATLTTVDDDIEEPDETAVLEARLDGAAVGSATVTIRANDTPSDDATLASLTLSKGDIGTFSPTTLSYAATVAHDVASTTVRVRPADTGASVTIADASGSTDQYWFRDVPLSAGVNAVTVTVTAEDGTTTRTYTVNVTRSKPAPTATIAADADSVAEGGAAAFTVTLDAAAPADLALALAVSETGAVLAGTAPASVAVAAGATSAAVSVATEDDKVVEAAGAVRAVTVTLSAGTGYTVGSPGSARVAVTDDDAWALEIGASPTGIEEGGSATVTVSITNGVTFAADQSFALTASGTASASDYTLSSTSPTLAAGESAVSATLAAVDDEVEEEAETVAVSATHNGNAVGTATVTIAASDASDDATLRSLALSDVDIGTFSAETTDYAAKVGHEVASTTVTAAPNDSGASVSVADAGGTTEGGTRRVALAEGDNAITATVTAADGVATRTYTVTVTRKRAPLTGTFRRLPAAHDGGTFGFRIRFSEDIRMLARRVAVTGGTVTQTGRVNDGRSLWRVRVRPAGHGDVTIALAAKRDCSEGVCTKDGRRLSARMEATVSGPDWPSASIAAESASVSEGEPATFRVTLSEAPAEDVAVAVEATETGAVLAGTPPASVTVAANQTQATLSLATDDDSVVEGDGAVTVRLRAGRGYVPGTDDAASTTVADDDAATFAVRAKPARIEEGGVATVTVRVEDGVTFAAEQTIALSTSGSASAADFSLPSSLTLAAGKRAVRAELSAVDDELEEADETVAVEVRHAGAAVGSATVTIAASDVPSDDATLASLTLSDVDIGTFSAETTEYAATVGSEVSTTTVTASANHAGAAVAIADADGTTEGGVRSVSLAEGDNAIAVTVTAEDGATTLGYRVAVTRERPPLTASFEDVPASHAGEEFGFRVRFSAPIATGQRRVRDRAFDVTGGTVTGAGRVDGSSALWAVKATPAGNDDVTIVLRPDRKCGQGVCTSDGRRLSNRPEATVAGPAPADASVDGAVLTLTFRTPRDAFAAPDGSDFAVLVDGAWRAVRGTRLSGRAALLALSAPVLPGQAVAVDYLGSAMHPLMDAAGVEVAPWTDLRAANVTGTAPPGAAAWLPAVDARAVPGLAAALRTARASGSLSLAGRGLGDAAAGLARDLPGLRRLDLSDNGIADLAPLAGLARLESLDLSGNAVSDAWPLAELAGLRRLDLSGNRVADLAPLAALPRLEVLVVDANLVADAGALVHLARLENLGLADNAVADLEALADLASLRRLDLGGNPAADASPVGDLGGTLVWLRLPATAQAPVERLVRLRWLWRGAAGACVGCGGARER